jgi:hypothetical protein
MLLQLKARTPLYARDVARHRASWNTLSRPSWTSQLITHDLSEVDFTPQNQTVPAPSIGAVAAGWHSEQAQA